MDPVGIILGIVVGVLLGGILGLQVGLGRVRGGGALPLPSPPDGRSGYVTKADLEHIELRLEDAYDKLHHLYDRTRKRLKVDDQVAAPGRQPPAAEAPLPLGRDAIKAAIRERIRLRREGT